MGQRNLRTHSFKKWVSNRLEIEKFEEQDINTLHTIKLPNSKANSKNLYIRETGTISIKDAKLLLMAVETFGFRWDWYSEILFTKYNPKILRKYWFLLKIKCGTWSLTEIETLKTLVKGNETYDWNEISKKINSKTAYFCKHFWLLYLEPLLKIQSTKINEKEIDMIKNGHFKWNIPDLDNIRLFISYFRLFSSFEDGYWNDDEVQALFEAIYKVKEYTSDEDKWNQVSKFVKSRSAEQCKNRSEFEIPSNFFGPWSDKEMQCFDELENSCNWSYISKYIKTRTKSQIHAYMMTKI